MFGKGEITSMYKGGCHEKEKKFVKEVFFCGGVITLRTEIRNIIFVYLGMGSDRIFEDISIYCLSF